MTQRRIRFAVLAFLATLISAACLAETVESVRLQGNFKIPDQEVLRLAGVSVGQHLEGAVGAIQISLGLGDQAIVYDCVVETDLRRVLVYGRQVFVKAITVGFASKTIIKPVDTASEYLYSCCPVETSYLI